jgi:hypothetical protein
VTFPLSRWPHGSAGDIVPEGGWPRCPGSAKFGVMDTPQQSPDGVEVGSGTGAVPDVNPLDVTGVRTVSVGTMIFLVASVVLFLLRALDLRRGVRARALRLHLLQPSRPPSRRALASSARTALAARRPDTTAPWMELVSRWSPATWSPLRTVTGCRNSCGEPIAGSACGITTSVSRSQAPVSSSCSSARTGSTTSSPLAGGPSGPCTSEVETSARPGGAYDGAAAETTMELATPEPSASASSVLRRPGTSGTEW